MESFFTENNAPERSIVITDTGVPIISAPWFFLVKVDKNIPKFAENSSIKRIYRTNFHEILRSKKGSKIKLLNKLVVNKIKKLKTTCCRT